jgi:hypothetical protein
VGGLPRAYLAGAVYGGMCMCRGNKKWAVDVSPQDFDAASLYPSVRARLYTASGIPRVSLLSLPLLLSLLLLLLPEECVYSFLENKSAYVVDIEMTNVRTHLHFPLIVQVDAMKNRPNNDYLPASGDPIRLRVDNIFLEDLIHYQQVDFRLVRRYVGRCARLHISANTI